MGNMHKNIFKKYSTGNATPKEEKAVNIFFDALAEQQTFAGDELTPQTGALLHSKIEKRIAQKNRRSYFRVAAAAVLLITAGLLYSVYSTEHQAALKTVSAQLGKQQKVILPDASVVYLNSGSSLTYPVAFDKESREVTLTGEAYFEVEHKTTHPFIITSRHLKTQVLGTRFIVSNYYGDVASVTVVSGKVKVTDKKSHASEIITKGQRVVYNPEKAALTKTNNVNTTNYLAWKDGRIFFDHANIKQVLQTLHRRYNITLSVNSPYYNCSTISGSFKGNDLQGVLSSIRFINNMDYTSPQNDTIKITLKPCKN